MFHHSRTGRRPAARRAGYTQVETVMSCAIMTVVVGAAMSLLAAAQASVDTGVAASVVESEARDLLERLAQELRQAGAGTLTPPNPKGAIGVSFQSVTGYANGTAAWGATVTYALVPMPGGGPLKACTRTSGGVTTTVGSNIVPMGLTFTQGAEGVTIALTLQKTLPDGRALARTVQTTVTLRN